MFFKYPFIPPVRTCYPGQQEARRPGKITGSAYENGQFYFKINVK